MKKNKNIIIIVSVLISIILFELLFGSIKSYLSSFDDLNNNSKTSPFVSFAQIGINENRSVYSEDTLNLKYIYITVLKSLDDSKRLSFTDLNRTAYSSQTNLPDYSIIFQDGDIFGPNGKGFGFGSSSSNADLVVRGKTTRESNIKSFKIKLNEKAGLWQDQRTVNLNKHPYDITMTRNKLSFDYFKLIPNITSLRTQFVQLLVKDMTVDGDFSKEFISYGQYTQIEQPNKNFLRSHGLDPNANLYKANEFPFEKNPDKLKSSKDPTFSKSDFDSILEIKGDNNHDKLLEMIESVNNYSISIDEVFNKYFDKENYFTWMAVNILMGNHDTISQNFFLYSPTNSAKWYFLPWDYDAAWDWENQEKRNISAYEKWQKGISTYWSIPLHRRILKNPSYLKVLTNKVNELSKIINEQKTKKLLDSYYPILNKNIQNNPDLQRSSNSVTQFRAEINRLPSVTAKFIQEFNESIEAPQPVFMGDINIINGVPTISWDVSYDLQEDDISYDISVASDPQFNNIIVSKTDIKSTALKLPDISKGIYFVKLIIKDSKGHIQYPYESYQDKNGEKYYGVKLCELK